MKNDEHQGTQLLPPYVPFRTFLNFLDQFKAGIPTHIDRSIMRSMSGAIQSWLVNSLRYMELINENDEPTERMRNLINSEGEERKKLLKQLFDHTYREVLTSDIDLTKTTPEKLRAAFANIGATGGTIEKCRAFFFKFADAAGIELSPFLRSGSGKTRKLRNILPKKQVQHPPTGQPSNSHSYTSPSIEAMSSEHILLDMLEPEMSEEEQQAVWKLILYFKNKEMK